MLEFDELGYLKPYKPIPANLDDIERHFVFNPRRKMLYLAFKNCLEELNFNHVFATRIWVNGSFTTLTKYPKDIDLVVFLPSWTYEQTKLVQRALKLKYAPKLDLFFEKDYPKEDALYSITLEDEAYWLNLFCFDRKGFDKGIIELSF